MYGQHLAQWLEHMPEMLASLDEVDQFSYWLFSHHMPEVLVSLDEVDQFSYWLFSYHNQCLMTGMSRAMVCADLGDGCAYETF